MTLPEQIDLTLAGLRAHYARGDFTPRQLVAELRRRSALYRDRNIWIHELDDAEIEPYLRRLDGVDANALPLYGVPFAIKDNIDLAGVPTTAACPAYAYTPQEHATVVALLLEAGAVPLGKTNLDQFATGLVGTRSPEPWGACRNSFDPGYISGGSSAGSAVAVALGLASFALGTDTAGSGRVPAAFNNILGWKPSKGLLSTRGVVPACRSLDCVSLFGLTAADLNTLFGITVQFDAADAYARPNPAHNSGAAFGALPDGGFRFGVPRGDQLQFFGDTRYQAAFAAAVEQLRQFGGTAVEIDFEPFLAAARLLYEGPWVAERYLTAGALLERQPEALLPVIATIIGGARGKSAADAFSAQYALQARHRAAEAQLEGIDFVVTPTTGTHFTLAQIAEQPIAHNSELGYYTNFMNLLDLSAVAVPTALLDNGLPFGITLFAQHHCDLRLLSYAQRLQRALQLPLGATGLPCPAAEPPPRRELATVKVVVCGAHMAGLPLNPQLTARRGRHRLTTTTAPCYRLFALPGGPVQRPGLIRDERGGAAIGVEVWELPTEEFGSFVDQIPLPLGIGRVQLQDGSWCAGFLCESYALEGAREITGLGDWRAFLQEGN